MTINGASVTESLTMSSKREKNEEKFTFFDCRDKFSGECTVCNEYCTILGGANLTK